MMDIIFLNTISTGNHLVGQFSDLLTIVLAQAIEDPDLFGNVSTAWENFVESGQATATVIGLVVGYIFKSMTSY